jgi:hypothetical protein
MTEKLIVNYCGVPGEHFFRFSVQLIGNFVNLILLATAFALHANLSAHP